MTGRKEISNYHLKNWMIRVNYENRTCCRRRWHEMCLQRRNFRLIFRWPYSVWLLYRRICGCSKHAILSCRTTWKKSPFLYGTFKWSPVFKCTQSDSNRESVRSAIHLRNTDQFWRQRPDWLRCNHEKSSRILYACHGCRHRNSHLLFQIRYCARRLSHTHGNLRPAGILSSGSG